MLVEEIIEAYDKKNSSTLFTVGISGIDASGKGFVTKSIQEKLEEKAYKVVNINLDPWQNPITVRLQEKNAAENFYNNVFRWTDVFDQLLFPLKIHRSINLETRLIRTDADVYYSYTYNYSNIDILLVEAILLFQEKYLSFFDYKIWIDCSFETGLKRALQRNVEKLDEEKLIDDYNRYYYAAQRLHFEKDRPRQAADIIFSNDDVLSGI